VAVLLSLSLFALWTAVGLALLNAGRFRGPVRKLLLAPTVGVAVFGLAAYTGVQFGFPVGRSAAAVGIGVTLGAAVGLWRTRGSFARARVAARRYSAFLLVVVATFFLTAWPLVRYGFDWVANGNDDMANYCLGAAGFRDHGFLRVPTPEEVRDGSDPTQRLWFLYHDAGTLTQKRCGAELTLALVGTWTGLTPQQVFMPVIAAFNMALIAATAGLVLVCTRRRAAALWAGALLAVSSQTAYGVVQQLIAQAAGLGLLCTSVAMVTSPFRRFPAGPLVRRAAVCGVTFAGLIVFYAEAVPFLVGACVLLGARDLLRRHPVRRHIGHAGAAITTMALVAPVYFIGTAHFLLGQAHQGTGAKTHTLEIFPFFMTPRGPALVWGMLPSYGEVAEPRLSAALVLGVVLLAALALLALAQYRRGRAFAAVLVAMMAMAAVLYVQKAAFGLFKIAMFAQPFIWATVAAWVVTRSRRWRVAVAAGAVLVVAGLNARTQYWYVKQSTGHDSRVDLPAATRHRVMTEFNREFAARAAAGEVARVVITSENNVLVKLISSDARRVPVSVASISPFSKLLTEDEVNNRGKVPNTPATLALDAMWLDPRNRQEPWMTDPDTGRGLHQLMHVPASWAGDAPDKVLVVGSGGSLSVLNRYRYPEKGPALVCAPLSTLKNVVVMRDATGARQLFQGMDFIEQVALHRLEPDSAFRHRTMAGVGRAVLVDVLNPSPRVRVVASYTGGHRPSPTDRHAMPAQVVGTRRVPLGAIGDGSARLVSPPVEPQRVGAANLLVLDFNIELSRPPNRVTGLEALWGNDLPRDRRFLSGHLRDFSVITEEEYAAFRPPEKLAKFPDDLTHEHLEYSGLYEHGWMNKAFKVRLTQAEPGHEAVVRGQIPAFPGNENFTTDVTILVDGRAVGTRALGTGDFEVRFPAGAATGPRWIEVRFSGSFILPGADGRPASAMITGVGFEPRDESKSRPPEKLTTFPADLTHPALAHSGIDRDGWIGQFGKARLWFAGAGRELVVRGNVPAFRAGFRTELVVLLDGAEVARRALGTGEYEVRVPAGAGPPGPRWVECRFTEMQKLPDPDHRTRAAVVTALGFEPKK
jgi:hypothetical protein